MPVDSPAAPPSPSTRSATASRAGFFRRFQVGTSVIIQLVLVAFIIAMVNFYAFKHFKRFDFSRDRKYALSSTTKQLLASLTKPVKLIVFMTSSEGASPIREDVINLAQEYRTAQPKYIQFEQIDPYRDLGRAKEVEAKYKLAQQENVVILDCEGRTKVITDDKMADVDRSGEAMGQPPQITAFTGEQAITSGLLEVTEGKKSNVYYLQGHGEPEIGKGKQLDVVQSLLDGEHLEVQPLNLLNVSAIPADAGALMVMGPTADLTDREIKLLDAYWQKGGRLMILLDPDAATPHLTAFLVGLGITPEDDRVLETLNLGNMTGIVRDVVTQFVGNTPIARQLAGMTPVFPGGAQSLAINPAAGQASGEKVEPLLQAVKGFWGETDYKDLENTGAYYDVGKDKPAPLTIVAIAEKGAVGDQRVQAGGSRMVVVGSAGFIANDALDERTANFFLSSLNWLLEREQLIGIAPKQVKTFTLNLPDAQVQQIFWMTILAIPGAVAFIGVIVWWRRRT
jgi:ABC-2 type transport system permease protein